MEDPKVSGCFIQMEGCATVEQDTDRDIGQKQF